jgi:hypothetical protein
MARDRLMVGTYGEISCFQLKTGSWQARARYCDVDGVVRQYRKNGETKNKARANLKAFFVEHTGTFGDGALAPDDTVQDLLNLWFEKMQQAEGGPSAETLGYYRSHVRWVLDRGKTEQPLGAYQLRHVRPVIIQAALDSSGVSSDMRKRIRSVLVRAFNMAIFHEAINGNPATAVPLRSRCRETRRSRFPSRTLTPYVRPSASGPTQRSATDPRASTCPTSSRCSSPRACASVSCWPCAGPTSSSPRHLLVATTRAGSRG